MGLKRYSFRDLLSEFAVIAALPLIIAGALFARAAFSDPVDDGKTTLAHPDCPKCLQMARDTALLKGPLTPSSAPRSPRASRLAASPDGPIAAPTYPRGLTGRHPAEPSELQSLRRDPDPAR